LVGIVLGFITADAQDDADFCSLRPSIGMIDESIVRYADCTSILAYPPNHPRHPAHPRLYTMKHRVIGTQPENIAIIRRNFA